MQMLPRDLLVRGLLQRLFGRGASFLPPEETAETAAEVLEEGSMVPYRAGGGGHAGAGEADLELDDAGWW